MPANPASLELTSRYHGELLALGDRIAEAVAGVIGSALERAPERGLQRGFRSSWDTAIGLITEAQARAQALAGAYHRRYGELELGRPVEVSTPALAGVTAYGSSVSEAFGSVPARTFGALADRASTADAIELARTTAATIARTLVLDTAREELELRMKGAGEAQRGWRWRTRGTCTACAGNEDGEILPVGAPLNIHPNCQCVQEPVFDVRETVRPLTASERFDRMQPAAQDAFLGPERAQLVRDRKITIPDLATTSPGPDGPVADEGTIAEAIAAGPAGSRPRGARRIR